MWQACGSAGRRAEVRILVQNAMLESALALSSGYGANLRNLQLHITDLLGRFTNAARQVLAEVSKLDTEGEQAQLILFMYEKILAGASPADLRHAADRCKAASLKDVI